uniref:Choline/ethanolamine kinase n=1 Tax=Syphacia muris TaxID=451379 RepID=A0A0N5APB3_9BILA
MSIVSEQVHFRDLKEILSRFDPNIETGLIFEVKKRSHTLCARFLGGAWRNISVEKFQLQRMRGGMSNMLFMCSLPDGYSTMNDEPRKVLMRIYFNPVSDANLVAESVIFTLLSERHLGPKLYGIFNGGRLEEYIPSRPLSCGEISIPLFFKKIAKRVAQIHQLRVPIWKEPVYLCDAIKRWLNQLIEISDEARTYNLPEKYLDCAPSYVNFKRLLDELHLLRQCLNKSRSPVVFCHNDLQEGNILLPRAGSGNVRLMSVTEDTVPEYPTLRKLSTTNPHLVLIDFEYASYNYRGFDFANHFVECTIDYDVSEAPYYKIYENRFPTEEHQLEFFKSYIAEVSEVSLSSEKYEMQAHQMILLYYLFILTALYKLNAELSSALNVSGLETAPFIAVSHLFWGIWSLLQVEVSPVKFGFVEYGVERLGLYYKYKSCLESLLNDSSS